MTTLNNIQTTFQHIFERQILFRDVISLPYSKSMLTKIKDRANAVVFLKSMTYRFRPFNNGKYEVKSFTYIQLARATMSRKITELNITQIVTINIEWIKLTDAY